MFYRLRRALAYRRFDARIRGIFDTPPLAIADSDLRIVSMVSARDLSMYLLAAKVLYKRIGHGRFVAIVDADLPKAPRETMRRHLGDAVEFITLEDIPVGRCQRGGTWERLLTCLDISERHYVMQMDADTLALGEIPEVAAAIQSNRAFSLAEGLPLWTLAEAADWGSRNPDDHIVDATDRAYADYPTPEGLSYFRGSSGFAGFAKGGFSRAQIEDYHVKMQAILGDRWLEWGSEQVGSNFAIANSPDPLLLGPPAYASFEPGVDRTALRLAHFIGTYRFDDGFFAAEGRRLIGALLS